MTGRTHVRGLLGAALLLALLSLPGTAQEQDARWSALIGCWVPIGVDGGGLLCFRPAGGGVEMFNVVDGEITASEPLVADGAARPVSAEGCTGTERVEFSSDGARAFTHSQFQCGNEARSGSGVMAFINASQWVDVRSLSVAGDPVAWAQGYEAASPELIAGQGIVDPALGSPDATRAARVRASRGLTVEDVEEAVARVEARAVEVWVAASESPFELSGAEIVRLADAGMPESVIDVMVAVSYPDRFRVSPEGAPSEAEQMAQANVYGPGYRRMGFGSYLFNPFRDPTGFRYSPLYSRFGAYGYDAFGYGAYGGYGGYWGYMPTTIIVQPASPAPQPRSRVVPGRGYTRDGTSSSSSGGSASRPSTSSGSSGSGGGSSSSSGGSSSSGRTAQPRPN